MAFPDWPLSNGSLNPEGWVSNPAMRAEHGHRLTGATVGLLTITLAVLVWKRDRRPWTRKLAIGAVGLVVVQGVLGGLRVLLDRHPTPFEGIDAGLVLRIAHGCFAQGFVSLLAIIVAASSRPWIDAENSSAGRGRASSGTLQAGWVLLAVLVTQLIVAAKMRHLGAGLAIPTFPLTPEGGLIPTAWDYGVGIHFTHRVLAVCILVAVGWWLGRLHFEVGSSATWKKVAIATALLLVIQIALGASIIWSGRHPHAATWHVLFGAGLLATTATALCGLSRLGRAIQLDGAAIPGPSRETKASV